MRPLKNIWKVIPLLLLTGSVAGADAIPFYMGTDISMLGFMQQRGVAFKQNGVPQPADQILYDAGDNLFRLRLFVNPDTNYSDTGGAIQTENYDIALAQQLKANDPGAKFLLDLHYSDTWADPGHQTTPAAWQGDSLAQLQTQVHDYTLNTLTDFKNAGVMPDMVQVGNEITNGLLWPAGQIVYKGTTAKQQASWQAMGSLVNSAISGVRAAQGSGPAVQIAVHVDGGDRDGGPQYFFSNLTNPQWGGVNVNSFDILGVSYYPSNSDGLSTLTANLDSLADTYNKKIMVLETDAPWENTRVAGDPNYPDTPAGQEQFLIDLRNVVMTLPNADGQGIVYWYPESVQMPGLYDYNGGATALFDAAGNALPALSAFAVTLPEPGAGILLLGLALIGLKRRRS